jgi:hypothetical protein
MERTYLKWLLSPTGLVAFGLIWPFGIAATLLLLHPARVTIPSWG